MCASLIDQMHRFGRRPERFQDQAESVSSAQLIDLVVDSPSDSQAGDGSIDRSFRCANDEARMNWKRLLRLAGMKFQDSPEMVFSKVMQSWSIKSLGS